MWRFSEHDHAWKSSEKLIRHLIDIASITLETNAKSATLLDGGKALKTSRDGGTLTITLTITLPAALPDPVATVIKLK